jgi:hypothetical protein
MPATINMSSANSDTHRRSRNAVVTRCDGDISRFGALISSVMARAPVGYV